MAIIATLTHFNSLIQKEKIKGKKIVFTNGCFDLLHAGHIEYLQFAKRQGDLLVVGVNTDRSVRYLKGKGRPLTPLKDRLKILSSLSMIDYLVPFGERTPAKLIKILDPDILVKGGDYHEKEVVGANWVTRYGGKVVIAPFKKGYSTSGLIKYIQSSK